MVAAATSFLDVLELRNAAEAAVRGAPWRACRAQTRVVLCGSCTMLMAGLEHVSCLMTAILCVSPGPGGFWSSPVPGAR